jgi:probable HAF family extracellular repeat protein
MAKANRLALSVLVVFSLAAFAAAQTYTITDLGPGSAWAINSLGDVLINNYPSSFVWTPGGSLLDLPPLPGDSYATATGINRQGLAVGLSSLFARFSPVLWTNGEPLYLGTLGGNGAARAINASGEVVGNSAFRGNDEAFLWTKATGMQGLGFLAGYDYSLALAINRFGQVVGYSGASSNNSSFYAFIWSKTTGMKNLGRLPGGGGSVATAINDLGQIAGYSGCGTGCQHAVLWSKAKGSMLDLGVPPGATYSVTGGINNVGQVVGWAFYGGYDNRAFVWSPSTGMLDLNNLIPANSGWLLQGARAINDQGQIVGYGTLNGQTEAFLLTPQ